MNLIPRPDWEYDKESHLIPEVERTYISARQVVEFLKKKPFRRYISVIEGQEYLPEAPEKAVISISTSHVHFCRINSGRFVLSTLVEVSRDDATASISIPHGRLPCNHLQLMK